MKGVIAIAGVVAVCGVVLVTVATAQDDGEGPVLHEDVRPPPGAADRRASAESGTLLGPEPAEGRNPSAFTAGDKLLPEPARGAEAEGGEPVHGSDEFEADRDTTWKPDRVTEMDGTLRYVEVFNPSILPFKRMAAMDGVRPDYTLYIQPSTHSRVEIGGKPDPDRDKFWGSVMLDLRPGKIVPLPSVAPTMRILSYEVEPKVALQFSKDEADNFYVRSDESSAAGQYRLNFLVDAPAIYFAPQIEPEVRITDIPRSMRPELPAEARESARLAIRQLRLSPTMRLREAIDIMAGYFRGFEASESPTPGRDIFWDLFKSKAGVCRHRSFAFVVIAHELGIPARYVTNEAHAWVEVYAPGSGWLRLDLGGAALNLEVSNAAGKTMYQPRADDPFQKPENYLNNYSRLEGEVDGLTPGQLSEAQTPNNSSDGEGVTTQGEGEGEDRSDRRMSPGPGENLPELPPESAAGKQNTVIAVARVSKLGYRGETIEITGSVRDDQGVGLPGLGVDLYIAPPKDKDNAVWLGQTLTKKDGGFTVQVTVPSDVDVGDYGVYAGTPGDDVYKPAVSK